MHKIELFQQVIQNIAKLLQSTRRNMNWLFENFGSGYEKHIFFRIQSIKNKNIDQDLTNSKHIRSRGLYSTGS